MIKKLLTFVTIVVVCAMLMPAGQALCMDNTFFGYDTNEATGFEQYVYGQKWRFFSRRVHDPENSHVWAGRTNPSFPLLLNGSGYSFVIKEIYAISDSDNYSFKLYRSNGYTDMSDENDTLIANISCQTDGTECYYYHYAYSDSDCFDIISTDGAIIWEHNSGAAGDLTIGLGGYFTTGEPD